jgi:hypothetical protein
LLCIDVYTGILIDVLMNWEERRQKVIDYISDHPGCNTEAACKGVESYTARVTFFKVLKELKEEGIVTVDDKSKPNARDNKLFVEETNLLVRVPRELDEFKRAFLNLVKKTESKIRAKDNKNKDSRLELLSEILTIYHHIVGVYLTYSILTWSQKIPQKEVLTKLNTKVFLELAEIQLKIAEIYQLSGSITSFKHVSFGDLCNPLLQKFIEHSFLLTPQKISSLLTKCKSHKLLDEVEPVLNIAWRIGFDLYIVTPERLQIKFLPEDFALKNWKMALAEAFHRY